MSSSSQDHFDLGRLMSCLRDAYANGIKCLDKSAVTRLLERYRSHEEEWSTFAKFDERSYTRNLLDSGNGHYNLLVLAWRNGQCSGIHDHANSMCFVKVLKGSIEEIRYSRPTGPVGAPTLQSTLATDSVSYMDDTLGTHEMRNESGGDAVTLHLYSPPIKFCTCFDRATGEQAMSEMCLHSVAGVLLPQNEGNLEHHCC